MSALHDTIVASAHTAKASVCLSGDFTNPWAAVGFLLDAQRKITHALDELTEVLGEQNPERLDRVYASRQS